MANKLISPSAEKAAKIREEILSKIHHYESRMGYRLQRWVEAAEMYQGRTATHKENSKASPNSAELFKAIRARRDMILRMLLGQKPCFELECMDIIGYDEPAKILKAEHYVNNQLEMARFDKGMARAIDQLLLYGSVAVHESYEPLRQSFLGQKHYVTTFRPQSLINCAFALDAYDIEESGWVAISDIQAKNELFKLKAHDPKGEVYNIGQIDKNLSQSDYCPEVNTWVNQRMAYAGYMDGKFENGMERVFYYGPLDCMNNRTAEYAVELTNREFIIRMEEYEGIRPVRIATVNTIDVEPLGNGLYDTFAPLLKKIDDTESALVNQIELAGLSMFRMQKDLTDEDAEFTMRQFGIARTSNPLEPIGPNPANIQAVAGYGADQVQKFRQAAGAPDTLQAIVSGEQATATATSLAMNEAVRSLSVQAQLLSPVLLADHIRVVLQNAQKYVTQPFVMNIKGVPVETMPSDLMIDVNVRVKTTTDQDFRPAKLQRLREGIQLMAMFPPNAIPGKKMNPGPAIEEYLKILDVPKYNETVQDITEEDMLQSAVAAQMGMGGAGSMPPQIQESEQEEGAINTPVGPVLAAPGDAKRTSQAIDSAQVQ